MEIVNYLLSLMTGTKKRKTDSDFPILTIAPLSVVTPDLLQLFDKHRLLRVNNQECQEVDENMKKCGNIMKLEKRNGHKLDGYGLRCSRHGRYISIRSSSWFAGRRIPLSQ